MPRRRGTPRSPIEQAEQAVARRMELVEQRLAGGAIRPPDREPLSDAQRVELWGRPDPSVDYDLFLDALGKTGVDPEIVQNLVVIQENPDNEKLIQAYSQPQTDPAVARALAVLAEHPFRLGILNELDGPDERVAESDRLDRLWQQQFAAPPAAAAPAPATPATPVAPAMNGAEQAQQYPAPPVDMRMMGG